MLNCTSPTKRRKRLACDVFDTLPPIPAMFLTSLRQTAGYKMAAHTVGFQTSIFQRTGSDIEWRI